MMSVEDNEKLTRTDRNTYMGEYLRDRKSTRLNSSHSS